MNIRHNEALRERLASEYVLGTLQGGARRRFERWLKDDAALRRAVDEWQDRLQPMAEFASASQPSPHIWHAIERRLDLPSERKRQAKPSFWSNLRDNLGFWRTLGMASTAAVVILASLLVMKQIDTVPAAYVATLSDDKAQATMLVTGDIRHRQLTVKVIAPPNLAADKSLELWAVPKDGAPRSLGLVAANGEVSLPLPDNVTPQSVPLLAISLEPKGGSPNPNGPSGPILYKGAWVRI